MILSVLDQSTVNDSIPQSQAIKETLQLSKMCEQLGYYRYWVSEHHNSPSVAGTAPEILVSAIASSTTRIRVGSAAVLLPYYSPYKIAEQFSVIESFAPGRIDLGVGRGAGADGLASRALNPNLNLADAYRKQIEELMHWVDGTPLSDDNIHNHGLVTANPLGYTSPDIWIMGSGLEGAEIAAEKGLPYSFAHFFNDGEGVEQALDIYRENFRPSEKYQTPTANICVWALAADTEQEAVYQAKTRNHWRIGFHRSERNPLVNPALITTDIYSTEELDLIKNWSSKAFVGTLDQVSEKLKNLSTSLGINEIVINTWTYDLETRYKSYALLAKLIS
jgi:luciferase family oxidoreductase group 1